ncbi:MAG: putative Rossmann fold flavoprotein [Akkermansiaceae bacterium]|jgi:predicted Rossmann fold flavoprotein
MTPPHKNHDLIVIGGGAAGFFGAITAGEGGVENILILEGGPEVLTKVRISGGGRCNVTHDCYDPRELVQSYPRGMKNLMGPFHRFQPADTITWFEDHGVELKVEADGRIFPITDNSKTIIDCLTNAARDSGTTWLTKCGAARVRQIEEGFEIETTKGELYQSRSLLIATGGIRTKNARLPAESLGHKLSEPVPSLFTFKIDDPRLHDLMGVSVPNATLKAGRIETNGPLLITHWGLSGPAALKASAWGARDLAEIDYQFSLEVNWTAGESIASLTHQFAIIRKDHGIWKVTKRSLVEGVTRRLWQRMCFTAGVQDDTTWANLTRTQSDRLIEELVNSKFQVTGKSINKDEFVTCGGVSLDDIQLKTMESKTIPGLYFAGEVLDVDGITGGFNFQSAWTTGHLAGSAIAERSSP